jgi:hypothetical protein
MKKLIIAIVAILVVVAGVHYVVTKDAPSDGAMTDDQTLNEKKPADPRITAAWQMMIGSWSSEDDRNLIREYGDAGNFTDRTAYAGGETKVEGEWSLFVSDNADEMSYQLNNKDVYVKQVVDGKSSYYRVMSVTPAELELTDLATGAAIRFGKMNGNEMQDGIEESKLLSVAFRCANQSSFVATFGMEQVTIESEGEANDIPMTTSTPGNMTFENNLWSFNFKGQGQDFTATVYDKTLKTTTSCNEQE